MAAYIPLDLAIASPYNLYNIHLLIELIKTKLV